MGSEKGESQRVHLVVLIHGLYGSPENLHTVREELLAVVDRDEAQRDEGEVEALLDGEVVTGAAARTRSKGKGRARSATPAEHEQRRERMKLEVLLCQSFQGSKTWDGVDVNAHRASQEIDTKLEELAAQGQSVEAISILGYSLGGLVARFLVGLLHHRTPSFFDTHRPLTFSTIATPHLGVLKYGSTLNTVIHTIGRRLFSRAGKQLYCLDKEWDGRCLLDVMADPDHIFVQALQLFPEIRIIANGCNDLTVPYPTASISLHDPFENYDLTRVRVEVDDDCIVTGWRADPESPFPPSESADAEALEDTVRDEDAADNAQWQQLEQELQRLTAEEDAFSVAALRKMPRPRLPPFLFMKGWKRYLPLIFLPLLLPLWLCFVFSLFALHTYQSAKRHRTFLTTPHSSALRPVRPASSSILTPDPDPGPDSNPSDLLHSVSSALDASDAPPSVRLRRRYLHLDRGPASRSAGSSVAPSGTSTPRLDPRPRPRSPSLPHRPDPAHAHAHDHPPPFHPARTPLHLTPMQEGMVLALHAALPQMSKVVLWFPWEYNSHPTIVVRTPGRFPARNAGRGALRRWARWVRDVEAREVGG